MRLPPNSWPNSKAADSILFVAQVFQELLHDFSWDSYRVFALDTRTRIQEALSICNDIRRERVPRQALEPALQEIVWSLESDAVARDCCDFDLAEFFRPLAVERTTPIHQIIESLEFLDSKFKGIKKKYEEKIDVLLYENSRIELRHVIGFYCALLKNTGYAEQYIYHKIRQVFFRTDIAKINRASLRRLFNFFDGGQYKFTVYIKADRVFATSIRAIFPQLEIKNAKADIDPKYVGDAKNFFDHDDKQVFLPIPVQGSKDEFSAYTVADLILNAAQGVSFLIPHRIPSARESLAYVVRHRAHKGRVISKPRSPLSRRGRMSTSKALQAIEETAKQLISNYRDVSAGRIIRALTTGALAQATPNSDAQIVSLWSAIEVLLTEPRVGIPRIVHYVDLLVPCICTRYIRRNFEAALRDFGRAYKKSLTNLLGAEQLGATDLQKFAAILTLEGRDTLRTQLLNLAAANPLGRHRLFLLHKNFSSPKDIRSFVIAHESRIRWQLHRIYRARNSLVHSGQRLPFAEALLMNLDEYFRATIAVLIEKAQDSESELDVDTVISEVGIEHRIYLEALRKAQAERVVTENSFSRLLRISLDSA